MLRLPERVGRALTDAGLLALCTWALTWPTLHIFALEGQSGWALGFTCLAALAFSIISALKARWLRGLLRLLILAGGLWWAFSSPLGAALQALAGASAQFRPAQHIVLLYADLLIPLYIAVIMPYVRLLMQGEPSFSAPLLLTNVLMVWFAGARQSIAAYLPAAAALPLLYAYAAQNPAYQSAGGRQRRSFIKAIPVALLIAALAFALTPPYRSTLPALEQKADELRQLMNDYFFFTSSRENFSLASEGYQPMGEKGLGGKPAISNTPVMEVSTDRRVYLRGAILNLYNGRAWYDTLSNERYGYTTLRFAALRDALLDADLPEKSLRLPMNSLDINLLSPMPSTLFVPQRLRSLSTQEGMVPYLNAASELFITRNLEPGDAYSLSYEAYIAGTQQTDSLAARLSGAEDPRFDQMKRDWLQLPQHLQPDGQVATLARDIVGAEADPYRAAMLIRDYLKNNFRYTLDVPSAPEDLDFVAHFLKTQEGYCTYFASAMTVLARSVGLPARYIEGFVAMPSESGAPNLVTGQNAHAWTEVYIPALGWVTFDATASTGELPPQPDSPDNSDGGSAAPPPQEQEQPQPTEGPEQTDAAGESPAPSPTPEPTPSPDDQPEEGPERAVQQGGFPWLWLLALLGCLSLLFWRLRVTQPHRQAQKQQSNTKKLLIYWQALCDALARRGLRIQPQETLRAYALRAAPDDPGLARLADAVSAVLYGKKQAADQDAMAARLYYQSAYAALTRPKRLRLALSRLGSDLRKQAARIAAILLDPLKIEWSRLKAAFDPNKKRDKNRPGRKRKMIKRK